METKIYQPIVVQYSEEIIQTLIETDFFVEHDIENYDFAKICLCDKLTEKFMTTGLDLEVGIFSEEEFDEILKLIVAGTLLYNLKNNGYINSYEDDDTEEVFFLTDKGREYVKKLKNEN